MSLEGWSVSAQEFLGSEISRLRNLSTEAFLRVRGSRASKGGEHPRVVLGRADRLSAPKSRIAVR